VNADGLAWTGPDWTGLAESRGVRLRACGDGPPVVVFPGLEGSGESCLHLVLPVLVPADLPARGRVILVDYAAERHRLLGELVATVGELLAGVLGSSQVTFWGQSFGNLLGALVAQQAGVPVARNVLVSPFTGLPQARVAAGRAALAAAGLPWAGRPLYRALTPTLSRYVFGPAPRGTGDPFFRAIAAAAPADVRRRAGWLAGTDFAAAFLALPGSLGIWLGERDRLVDLPRQLAFYTALARAPGSQLLVIGGSGHVVLPPDSVEYARATIAGWLGWAEPARLLGGRRRGGGTGLRPCVR
jgi:pimeloyl-ACP methyl ester carboxylesterase